jgi:hypothetical protein
VVSGCEIEGTFCLVLQKANTTRKNISLKGLL